MQSFAQSPRRPHGSSQQIDHQLRGRVKELERKILHLELVGNALWEFLRQGMKLTEADLKAKLREIDLRDGVEDGRITEIPLKCPTCGRVSSPKHWKCLYCGLEFERSVIG